MEGREEPRDPLSRPGFKLLLRANSCLLPVSLLGGNWNLDHRASLRGGRSVLFKDGNGTWEFPSNQ